MGRRGISKIFARNAEVFSYAGAPLTPQVLPSSLWLCPDSASEWLCPDHGAPRVGNAASAHRATKQLLAHQLNGPGHLAGVLPKGSILSNTQAKYSNLPLWTQARTVCLTVSSQLLGSRWDRSGIVGWHLGPFNNQIRCDRWAVKCICPAWNSCTYQKETAKS